MNTVYGGEKEEMSKEEFKGTQPTYTTFISNSLQRLFYIKLNDSPYQFYKALRDFMGFLPKAVKDELKPLFNEVNQKIAKRTNRRSIDIYTSRRTAYQSVNNICYQENDALLEKTINALDSHGYLERME